MLKVCAVMLQLVPLVLARTCVDEASCVLNGDETSLLQVKSSIKHPQQGRDLPADNLDNLDIDLSFDSDEVKGNIKHPEPGRHPPAVDLDSLDRLVIKFSDTDEGQCKSSCTKKAKRIGWHRICVPNKADKKELGPCKTCNQCHDSRGKCAKNCKSKSEKSGDDMCDVESGMTTCWGCAECVDHQDAYDEVQEDDEDEEDEDEDEDEKPKEKASAKKGGGAKKKKKTDEHEDEEEDEKPKKATCKATCDKKAKRIGWHRICSPKAADKKEYAPCKGCKQCHDSRGKCAKNCKSKSEKSGDDMCDVESGMTTCWGCAECVDHQDAYDEVQDEDDEDLSLNATAVKYPIGAENPFANLHKITHTTEDDSPFGIWGQA